MHLFQEIEDGKTEVVDATERHPLLESGSVLLQVHSIARHDDEGLPRSLEQEFVPFGAVRQLLLIQGYEVASCHHLRRGEVLDDVGAHLAVSLPDGLHGLNLVVRKMVLRTDFDGE